MPSAPIRFAVIPVIDLKRGQAVHARGGRRDTYRPICSPLCPSSNPPLVAARLMAAVDADTLYVADLDAIEGREPQIKAIDQIQSACAGAEVWLDAALADVAGCAAWRARGVRPVVGSESLKRAADLRAILHAMGEEVVLSLDFGADGFRGPSAIRSRSELWPDRLILMTLARVGSGAGPDLTMLADYLAAAGGRKLYAAGGVRSAADLQTLLDLRVAGALVGGALHSGAIAKTEIAALRGERR